MIVYGQFLLQVPEKSCCKFWEQEMLPWRRTAIKTDTSHGIIVRCWMIGAKGGVIAVHGPQGLRYACCLA